MELRCPSTTCVERQVTAADSIKSIYVPIEKRKPPKSSLLRKKDDGEVYTNELTLNKTVGGDTDLEWRNRHWPTYTSRSDQVWRQWECHLIFARINSSQEMLSLLVCVDEVLITHTVHRGLEHMQMNAFLWGERSAEGGGGSGRLMWVCLNKRLQGGGQRQWKASKDQSLPSVIRKKRNKDQLI